MAEEDVATWVIAVLATVMAVLGLFLWARSVDLGMAIFGFGLLVFGLGFDFWLMKRHFDLADARARGRDQS
jgi:hypothetical protein